MKRLLRSLRNAWKSLTINWGLLLALVGYFQDNIAQVMPTLKRIIPNDDVGTFVTFVGLVVIVLRFKTTQALSDK